MHQNNIIIIIVVTTLSSFIKRMPIKLPKKNWMFILVCQKFVCVCVCVCVYVFPHGCGLLYRRIWMKLGTKLDDDAEMCLK
jgi:hypothetical protein